MIALGQRTSLEAAECSAAPVVAALAVLALGNHPRRKAMKSAIARAGMWDCVPEFYRGSGKTTPSDRIDYTPAFRRGPCGHRYDGRRLRAPAGASIKTGHFEKLQVPATPLEVTPK